MSRPAARTTARSAGAALADLGRLALNRLALDDLHDAAVAQVAGALGVPAVSLVQAMPDGTLRIAASHGWSPGVDLSLTATGPLARALRARGQVMLPDLADLNGALPARLHADLSTSGLRSSCGVLVGSRHRPWGALVAHAADRGCFSRDEVHFLEAVANIVAAAQAQHEAELQMRHLSAHDALTGLPNREQLLHRLTAALRVGARSGSCTALLLIDMDGFKDINDSQGHHVGDVVLHQIARRLRAHLPDVADRTLARLGGDEFAIVLGRLDGVDAARRQAAALCRLLGEPYQSPGGAVSLGASIGIAVAPEQGDDAQALLRQADLAMYRAKRERSGFAVHDATSDANASSRLRLVNDLRTAIADGSLTVAYQPVIDLRTRQATSVEVLARWEHPSRGPQAPTEFIALAEQSGLIQPLTERIIFTAAQQCARWLERGRHLPIAINLSPALLGTLDYADQLRAALAGHGLPPQMVRVEVTESTLARDSAVSVLREISAMGIRVAIDDFGTGYSSLNRLKRLPVRTVKIDRTFVVGITDDRRDVAIVRSVVALAEELGLRVIAEGVETAPVANTLAALGVQRAQGDFYSPPLAAAHLERWHDRWRAGVRTSEN